MGLQEGTRHVFFHFPIKRKRHGKCHKIVAELFLDVKPGRQIRESHNSPGPDRLGLLVGVNSDCLASRGIGDIDIFIIPTAIICEHHQGGELVRICEENYDPGRFNGRVDHFKRFEHNILCGDIRYGECIDEPLHHLGRFDIPFAAQKIFVGLFCHVRFYLIRHLPPLLPVGVAG